uniref:Uncharacterized protein n=1 Tax=Chlamydomonas leiostraca TaxID=1034604 RepID=A0A7S0WIB6_9CHLO|mmetsp:Transcript_143/g.317  ORF Transcript_143/g.317 Transcript_143/m.317 type:complete len:160 (+) Transcript_143:123-602(+)
MTWDFLLWLFVLIINSGLVGRTTYALICLTDLEQDFINPYDLSNRLNRFVIAEYAGQFIMTAALIAGGKWFCAALHIAVSAYMITLFVKKQVYIDATDAFKQLKGQKFRRGVIFGCYCFSFVMVVFRLVETIVHQMLTPEGRETARKLFKEAAVTLPGY